MMYFTSDNTTIDALRARAEQAESLRLVAVGLYENAQATLITTVGELRQAERDRDVLAAFLKRAAFFVQCDVQMCADITRFAPLDPDGQSLHDSTESASEILMREMQESPVASAAIACVQGQNGQTTA